MPDRTVVVSAADLATVLREESLPEHLQAEAAYHNARVRLAAALRRGVSRR